MKGEAERESLASEFDRHRAEEGEILESYHARKYAAGGIDAVFVQDNASRSKRFWPRWPT